jgi:hypothetical protein
MKNKWSSCRYRTKYKIRLEMKSSTHSSYINLECGYLQQQKSEI